MRPPLRVVGPPWLADDLGGTPDRGFETDGQPADWWCSGTHYARLVASGLDVAFSTPGGCLPLIGLPGRPPISVVPLGELLGGSGLPQRVFAKPNDVKLEAFPADVYSARELTQTLVGAVDRYTHAESLPVALCEPMTFGAEARCFVLDGQVVSTCAYTDGHGRLGRGLDDLLDAAEVARIREVVEGFVASADLPRAAVVDVGHWRGEWVLIETNPAASSSWYCDIPPPGVAEAIRAGQHDEARHTWTDPITHIRTRPLPRT